jgi:hypothetical protein
LNEIVSGREGFTAPVAGSTAEAAVLDTSGDDGLHPTITPVENSISVAANRKFIIF